MDHWSSAWTTLGMVTLQDGDLNVPGMDSGAPAQPGTTGQPAGGAPAGGQGPGGPGGFGNLFFLVAIGAMFILMIFMSGRAQKAERRKKQELLASLSKHDKVQTIGGVIGTVTEIRDEEVILKIDDSTNTKMTFAKSAIQQVVRAARGDRADAADTKEPELSAVDS